jgi:SAM-dependent methyltransferase
MVLADSRGATMLEKPVMYTNSAFDKTMDDNAAGRDEKSVRAMYERAPYPGLGAGLKDMSLFLDVVEPKLAGRHSVRFLDAGCGTGHYLVGVAKRNPDWSCFGLDLSQASLDVAAQLATRHGARATLARGSYLEALPFDGKFDVIAAIGTVHHCADPLAAMRNLHRHLADDGFLLFHVYGLRLDREKFDIKEMLDIFEPDLSNVERRFAIYEALMRHRRRHWAKRLVQMPLIDIYAAARVALRNLFRKARGEVWSPPFTARYDGPTAPWIDHFCHPCERAYEVPEILGLIEDAGFEIARNLGQGREFPALVPPTWRPDYDALPASAKMRLSELLAFRGGSFRFVLKKRAG